MLESKSDHQGQFRVLRKQAVTSTPQCTDGSGDLLCGILEHLKKKKKVYKQITNGSHQKMGLKCNH